MSQSRVVWPRSQLTLSMAIAFGVLSCDVPPSLAVKRDAGDAAMRDAQFGSGITQTDTDGERDDDKPPKSDDTTHTDDRDNESKDAEAHSSSNDDDDDEQSDSGTNSTTGGGGEPDPVPNDLDEQVKDLCGGAEFTIEVSADGAVHVRCDGKDIVVVEPRDPSDDEPTNTDDDQGNGDDDTQAPSDDDEEPPRGEPDSGVELALCRPVDAIGHQQLPARAQAMSADAASTTERAVLVTDLYDRFRGWCGACHVDFGLGGLQVNFNTFQSKVTDKVIEQMRKSDPKQVMPPGKLFSERGKEDPVVEMYHLLKTWRAAADEAVKADPNAVLKVFFLPAEEASTDVSPYVMSPALGASLTNLGSCIPDAALVNSENVKSKALDDMFATATTLPKDLRDTDLFTLDSAELARYGVIGYAPTYPLFSDDAGKMRQLRVPRGTSISFDKATQSFSIPPNTRFYKTFLKRVTDKDGNVDRWRKMETRIVLSRPNRVNADGTEEPTALFGTYRWDDDEKEARLVEEPLRNGQPFRDVVFQYLTDEVQGAELIEHGSPDIGADLMTKGWGRFYGIPGSQRCIDCHRGSDSHSFVLGFGPLQANRLPMDEDPNDGIEEHLHGIVEAPGPDELNQLQRLIDYGLVTGIEDPTDEREVYPLELTQDTAPRTDYELTAQGYMVGNCAFCHNPNGLASYENPVLRNVLDFYPDADGGIFGFPLTGDKAFSPRILRQDGMMRIPYVSPEMIDRRKGEGVSLNDAKAGLLAPWRSLIYRNVDTPFTYVEDGALFPKMPLHVPGYDSKLRKIMGEWMASLPAREVAKTPDDKDDAEQTYQEVFEGEPDFEQALTDAEARLDAYRASTRYSCTDFTECAADPVNCSTPCVDTRDIVAHEVLNALRSGQGDYAPTAYARTPAAGIPERPHWVNTDLTEPKLDHWEPRRADWPEVLLVDADPVAPPGGAYPSTTVTSTSPSTTASATATASANDSSSSAASSSADPSTSTSATASASSSALRMASAAGALPWGAGGSSEWLAAPQAIDVSAVVGGAANTAPSTSTSASATTTTTTTTPSTPPSTSSTTSSTESGGESEPPPPDPNDPRVMAVDAVRELRLTDDFRKLALGERPLWFWETAGHDCDLSGVPTPNNYVGEEPSEWFGALNEVLKSEPLYSISPGEAVFTNICANCHGPQADSKGRQATTVALMSGGETRVANLRDGLFGIGNIEAQFGSFAGPAGVTPEDLAVRYVSWMALGGTQRRIPSAILELVARTKVFGKPRPGSTVHAVSPNMLEAAARFCSGLLPPADPSKETVLDLQHGLFTGDDQQFVPGGDHRMWYDLCTYDNPEPLVVLTGVSPHDNAAKWGEQLYAAQYVRRLSTDGRPTVPNDWPVGNQRGETAYGLAPDNLTPWCVEMPAQDPNISDDAPINHYRDAQIVAGWWEHEYGGEFPFCPPDVLGERGTTQRWTEVDRQRFGSRGAANAGMAVFAYLEQVIQEGLAPHPPFNRCEDR